LSGNGSADKRSSACGRPWRSSGDARRGLIEAERITLYPFPLFCRSPSRVLEWIREGPAGAGVTEWAIGVRVDRSRARIRDLGRRSEAVLLVGVTGPASELLDELVHARALVTESEEQMRVSSSSRAESLFRVPCCDSEHEAQEGSSDDDRTGDGDNRGYWYRRTTPLRRADYERENVQKAH